MTIREMIKVFEDNPHDWCEEGCQKALKKLEQFDPDMSLEELIKIPGIIVSEWAYYWAYHIGDRNIMKHQITESEWAYYWAYHIGDRDFMIDRITESKWAYYWAKDIGNREIMRGRITESKWAHYWARDI